jgi:hypothetical protein
MNETSGVWPFKLYVLFHKISVNMLMPQQNVLFKRAQDKHTGG